MLTERYLGLLKESRALKPSQIRDLPENVRGQAMCNGCKPTYLSSTLHSCVFVYINFYRLVQCFIPRRAAKLCVACLPLHYIAKIQTEEEEEAKAPKAL